MDPNYTGQLIDSYPDGRVKALRHYLNGRKVWVWSTFYWNGKLESEGGYVDDRKNGLWRFFLDTGKLDYTEEWKDGEMVGKHKGPRLRVGIPIINLPPIDYD